MKNRLIASKIGYFIIPILLLYALYVQFHGDYSPGGGFQAGVLLASGLILYEIIHGMDELLKIISIKTIQKLSAIGVLLYFIIGLIPIFLNKEFLNYYAYSDSKLLAQHIGIFLIELGVGITVFSSILLIYISFSKFKVN